MATRVPGAGAMRAVLGVQAGVVPTLQGTEIYQRLDISVTCHDVSAGGAPALSATWGAAFENASGVRDGRLSMEVPSAMATIAARTQRERRFFMVCLLRFKEQALQPGRFLGNSVFSQGPAFARAMARVSNQ